jgi:hypothetical protein
MNDLGEGSMGIPGKEIDFDDPSYWDALEAERNKGPTVDEIIAKKQRLAMEAEEQKRERAFAAHQKAWDDAELKTMVIMGSQKVEWMPRYPLNLSDARYVLPMVSLEKVRESEYALFTLENLKMDESIGMYDGAIEITNEFQNVKKNEAGEGNYLLTMDGQDGTEYTIDARLCGSVIRYADHACGEGASCYMAKSKTNTSRGAEMWLHAKRAIKAGESLTFDYNWALDLDDKTGPTVCLCKTGSCRGYIETVESVLDWLAVDPWRKNMMLGKWKLAGGIMPAALRIFGEMGTIQQMKRGEDAVARNAERKKDAADLAGLMEQLKTKMSREGVERGGGTRHRMLIIELRKKIKGLQEKKRKSSYSKPQ